MMNLDRTDPRETAVDGMVLAMQTEFSAEWILPQLVSWQSDLHHS